MKVLVTGGCGFIGTNLVRHLLAHTDHNVVNVDKLTYAANPQSLCDVDSRRYRLIRGDIADADLVNRVFAEVVPDAVIHLAAESHVDRSIDDPAAFIQTNVVGTFHLLNASRRMVESASPAQRSAFRFLHVSTDEVYGSLGDSGLFSETSRYDPHSPYSASKAASDHLARAWTTTYQLPVLVTNCSNNYGPYQFPEKLIPLMVLRCLGQQPLPVYGRGANVRDWLHVDDHVTALLQVLQRGEVGQTYHVGGHNERSNLQIVRSICDILDRLRPRGGGGSYADLISFVSDRPGHDYRYAIDSSKIQRELGWRPQHDLNSGLQQTVQWYLDHQTWWQPIVDGRYPLQRLGQSDD